MLFNLYSLCNRKDTYLARHHTGAAFYATCIALSADPDANQISILQTAALVHDIGKIVIPLAILQKNGQLSSEEWLIIRQHPVIGAEIFLQKYWQMEYAKEISATIKHHHERWDGTGYPDRLKGEQIPYLARILAIADSFDAMTGGRPYKKKMDGAAAIRELERNAGIMYDPALVTVAKKVLQTINIYSFSLYGEQKTEKGDGSVVNFG